MKRVRAAILTAVVALTACGGGGGGSTTPLVRPTAASPGPSSTTTPTTPQGATTATFVLVIAGGADAAAQGFARRAIAAGRRPAYISPSTLGVLLTILPQGSTTAILSEPLNVSSGSGICTSGSPRTCTISIPIAPGSNYTMELQTYDEPPVSGSIPSGAHLLSTSTITQSIIAYQPNSINFYLEGVVAEFQTGGGTSYASLPADASAHTYGVSIIAEDAAGNPISTTTQTPYANPITVSLAESGGSGHTSLVLNGTNVGTSATLSQSTDTLSLTYDGGGSVGYTTLSTISAAGASASTLRVSPLYATGTFAATDAAQTNTVTLSEASAPGTVAYTASVPACAGFALASSNLGAGSSANASVTSPPATTGQALHSTYSCTNATLSDSLGSSLSVPVSATIPTTTVCASAASSIYLGAKSGSSYEVGSGSPCSLTVSASSVTIYAPPAVSGDPTSGSFTISEANDTSTPSVNASACSSTASVTPSTAAGASLLASASGSVAIASTPITSPSGAQCNLIVNDGNGQTQNVVVTADPAVVMLATNSANQFGYTQTCTNSQDPITHAYSYVCGADGNTGPLTFSNGATTFTSATNTVAITTCYAGSSCVPFSTYTVNSQTHINAAGIELEQGGEYYCIPTADQTAYPNDVLLTLPNGPGTYSLFAEYDITTAGGGTGTPESGTLLFNTSLVSAPNNTGTVTTTAATPAVNACI